MPLVERSGNDGAFERLFHHGGDIHSAGLAFPDAPRPWIDLSTGINPIPYPVPPLPIDIWRRLPEPADLARLEAVAAARFGANPACVVAAAGTQSLIQWLPRLFSHRSVAVLGPTYAEHERCWRAIGAEVSVIDAIDELGEPEAVVIVNPNNPDGRLAPRDAVRALARRLSLRGALLVVDEAFMDFGRNSVASDALPSTIVLRSFGKAYGLAGVRLGFAIAPAALAATVRSALGPWSVSGPAIAIATQALAHGDWLATTQARLRQDGGWLDRMLADAGFEVLGGTPLFRLARHEAATHRFRRLCEFGILVRPFPKRPEWLRFGIPTIEQRERFARALEHISNGEDVRPRTPPC